MGGVMSPMAQANGCNPGDWLLPFSKSQTEINRVADTILLSDKFNADTLKAGGWGNVTGFFGATFLCIDCFGQWDWGAPVEIPDARIAVNNAFPFGPDGA